MNPTAAELAATIDHTLLKPDATPAAVEALCGEALAHGFKAVCVNGAYVPLVARLLASSAVLPCAVVGFPLGAMHSVAKAAETRQAIADGAREIDVVMPIGAAKAGDWGAVRADLAAVLDACGVCRELGVAFVKTSTGFGPRGASVADVALMRGAVGPDIGVKASGGIRDLGTAYAMLAAGANRLGTSAGVAILAAAAADAGR